MFYNYNYVPDTCYVEIIRLLLAFLWLHEVKSLVTNGSCVDVSEHYKYDSTKVINFVPPEDLKKIIDFTLPTEGVGITPDLSSAFRFFTSSFTRFNFI
jgi:hypothetical protein